MTTDIRLDANNVEVVGNRVRLRRSGNSHTIEFDVTNGNLALGGNGRDGDVTLKTARGVSTIVMNGDAGEITLGGREGDGHVVRLTGDDGSVTCSQVIVVTAAGPVDLFQRVTDLETEVATLQGTIATLQDGLDDLAATVAVHHP